MRKRILLVEGPDDLHVMCNLFEVREVPKTFDVKLASVQNHLAEERDGGGGVETLLKSIPVHLLEADLDCLALVIDANDKGPAARWQAIRGQLLSAGYDGLPERHGEQGTLFNVSLRPQTPRSVRFGAWIMPDNRSQGMIEDFVANLIREGDAMWPHVDGFLNSIPPPQRRFVPAHLPKARIHSWLAVSERPGRPMGQAIKADQYVDAHHSSVEPFIDWIERALLQ